MIVGAVYRGKDTLDGVVSSRSDTLLEGVSDMLVESKHHGQVRVIILDEKQLPEPVSVDSLWERTGKPVLMFSSDDVYDQRYHLKYRGKTIQVAGIDEGSIIRVLDKIMTEKGTDGLKIAGIILNRIPRLHNV